ncbi:hypothetical protein F7725_000399 [Dissostichus mawsoni]|uniref:B3/B4 tRNA-binding domain-containing protein n=1 Tax=Dissostichus mawsoni TaxID=36200 RepID=A0A7J5ZEA4_DISMA|nr:hypothetical protein F7725_000399 [Dissostichus mawsoni]
MDDIEQWPEIEKVALEKRRELVFQGAAFDERIASNGGLCSAIYTLKLLNYLEVSQCPSLTEIHEDIQHLTSLQSLILCRNKLASIPSVVGQLKSLKVLDISANNLTVLPEGITQLKELNTLNVSCNSLEVLPEGLSKCTRLSTINISKNKITAFPADFYSEKLDLLSMLVAYDNSIEQLSGDVHKLAALKMLDLSNNKLKEIPPELSDCAKLKEINFKGNKLSDKRLEKMVNGCQTKSILEYLRGKGKGRQGEEGADAEGGRKADKGKRQQRKKKDKGAEDEVEELNKMVVKVLHVSDTPEALTVTVSSEVKDVRPYLVCCIVRGMNLKSGNALKRFLVAQTKLHDDLCGKRTIATIATHDVQLIKAPLVYDVKPPTQLKVVSLGRKEMTAELIRQLQLEADELRKQKKRQNIKKTTKELFLEVTSAASLQTCKDVMDALILLLKGKEMYPCLVDAEGHVISFPPITNSEKTKIKKTTKELFLEVTSAASLQTCKDVMDALIVEEAGSDGEGDGPQEPEGSSETSSELIVQQVRTVDQDGSLKVVYPSKTDLCSAIRNLTVVW